MYTSSGSSGKNIGNLSGTPSSSLTVRRHLTSGKDGGVTPIISTNKPPKPGVLNSSAFG